MEQTERMALAQLAQSQCGMFSAAQAARLGLGHAQLSRASRQGHLRRVRSGVYAVGGVPRSPREPLLAAALAAGPCAVISHAGAAAFHRLDGLTVASHLPELIVPRDHHPRLSGVVFHRCGPLSSTGRHSQVRSAGYLSRPGHWSTWRPLRASSFGADPGRDAHRTSVRT